MSLNSVASQAESVVPGIPWGSLGQQPIYNPAYLTDYLVPAFQEAKRVAETLQIVELGPDKALSDFASSAKEASKVSAPVERAIASNQSTLSSSDAFQMRSDEFQGFVSQIWYTGTYGAGMHVTGVVNEMIRSGKMSEADAMKHADRTYRALKALVRLDRAGALGALKKGSLGAIPLIPIVIGVVLVVLIIAGTIVWLADVSEKNAILDRECKGATGEKFRICAGALQSGPGGLNLNAAIGGMTKWLVLGGLAVLAVAFAPFVVKQTMSARKELKAAS